MASTYSTNLRFELIGSGEQSGSWGSTTNTNIGTLIEEAISGVSAVTHDDSANYSLTTNNGSTDEARQAVLEVGGALSTTRNLVVPTSDKLYLVYNNTGQSIIVKTTAGTGITIVNGDKQFVYCDGTNVVDGINNLPSGSTIGGSEVVTLTASQTLTNKTLTSPIMTGPIMSVPQIQDTSSDHQYIFAVSELAADRTVTLPLLTGNDTFVFAAFAQTLTNKTLTAPVISSIVNTGTLTLPTSTDTLVGKATTDTFTNKTFDANGTGNSLSNVDVADLSTGTDGELITWDSSGNPATVGVGTSGHLLTSNGAGAAPTFQAGGSTDFSSGDKLIAWQSTAPTGWTKDTTAGLDEAALRIITTGTFGTSTSGDTYSTVFGNSITTAATTISTATMPAHTHSMTYPIGTGGQTEMSVTNDGDGGASKGTTSTGGGGSHTHSMTMDLNRQDVILISKD